MERKLYKLPFRGENTPQWTCPTCGRGVLKIKKDTFHSAESSSSKRLRGHSEWEPEWIEYVYTCLLECTNHSCKDIIANSGEGGIESDIVYDDRGYPEQDWGDYFRPKYFQPHLKLINIPKNTPQKVTKKIEQSFEIFFANPDSASNHIRIAVEEILTFLKVSRYEIRDGKRVFISLHKRIYLIPTKYNNLKDLFLAIKWLGNAGSHGGKDITLDDVMDAYEIMDFVLNELFENKQKQAKKLAKTINKKKGPKGKN